MSYVQQGLTDGTVLTAAHMNHIDAGIAANELSVIGIGALLTAIENMLNPPAQVTHSVAVGRKYDEYAQPQVTTELVADGSAYQLSITPDSGYELVNVIVTMGGTDITATAYANGAVNIASVTDDVSITVTMAYLLTVTAVLTHVSSSNAATSVRNNSQYQTTLTPDPGYELSTVTVIAQRNDTDITSLVYSDGVISTILTDDIVITATATQITHSVIATLSHVTNSNAAVSVAEGGAYQATLSADSGYELSSVTVTMGGTDITAAAYSNGTISIASVTDDIIITATATEISDKLGTGKLGTMRLGTRNA